MTECEVAKVLQLASGVLALGAAGFWFTAAWVARASFLNTRIRDFDLIQQRQAKFNALGAICAGLAAFAQIALMRFPTCFDFG